MPVVGFTPNSKGTVDIVVLCGRVKGKRGEIVRKRGRRYYYVSGLPGWALLPEKYVAALTRRVSPTELTGIQCYLDTLNSSTD